MTIIDFPTGIYPVDDGGGCAVVSNYMQQRSSRTGKSQSILRHDGEIWRQEVTLITRGSYETALASVIAQLRGRLNVLRCPDLFALQEEEANFAGLTAPVVSLSRATAVGDTRLLVNMDQPDQSAIPVGSRVQLGDRLYAVTGWFPVSSQIEIHPPARAVLAQSSSVMVRNAKGLWRVDAGQPEIVHPGIWQRTLKMIEAIH